MEEISIMLKNIQAEMQQQKIEIREMKEEITNAINNSINERFRNLEEKNTLLEDKIKMQEQSLDYLTRRKNLIFFGVDEKEKYYNELETNILNLINNDMHIPCGKSNIESVRRLGKKESKIRPVVVTFTTLGKKIEILKNKKSLAEKSFYVKEDFPKEILNKRRELQTQLKKERENGKYAVLRYDKLIVREKEAIHTNKRHLSVSPKDSEVNGKKSSTQLQKRNKIEMKKFIAHTPRNIASGSQTHTK